MLVRRTTFSFIARHSLLFLLSIIDNLLLYTSARGHRSVAEFTQQNDRDHFPKPRGILPRLCCVNALQAVASRMWEESGRDDAAIPKPQVLPPSTRPIGRNVYLVGPSISGCPSMEHSSEVQFTFLLEYLPDHLFPPWF